MPQTPALAVHFKRLFCTLQGFVVFVLGMIAICYVAPSFCVVCVNANGSTKYEDSFVPLLKLHVSTSAGELLSRVKHVDCECLVETLNSFLEFIFEEIVTSQAAHRSRTLLI